MLLNRVYLTKRGSLRATREGAHIVLHTGTTTTKIRETQVRKLGMKRAVKHLKDIATEQQKAGLCHKYSYLLWLLIQVQRKLDYEATLKLRERV